MHTSFVEYIGWLYYTMGRDTTLASVLYKQTRQHSMQQLNNNLDLISPRVQQCGRGEWIFEIARRQLVLYGHAPTLHREEDPTEAVGAENVEGQEPDHYETYASQLHREKKGFAGNTYQAPCM